MKICSLWIDISLFPAVCHMPLSSFIAVSRARSPFHSPVNCRGARNLQLLFFLGFSSPESGATSISFDRHQYVQDIGWAFICLLTFPSSRILCALFFFNFIYYNFFPISSGSVEGKPCSGYGTHFVARHLHRIAAFISLTSFLRGFIRMLVPKALLLLASVLERFHWVLFDNWRMIFTILRIRCSSWNIILIYCIYMCGNISSIGADYQQRYRIIWYSYMLQPLMFSLFGPFARSAYRLILCTIVLAWIKKNSRKNERWYKVASQICHIRYPYVEIWPALLEWQRWLDPCVRQCIRPWSSSKKIISHCGTFKKQAAKMENHW